MQHDSTSRRIVAAASIVSMPLAVASILVGLAAADFNPGIAENPAATITLGAARADQIYWSMIFDMLGYYLFLVPAALYLWRMYKLEHEGLAALSSLAGLCYILIGAMGAAALAAACPPMMRDYAQASPPRRETLELVYSAITDIVYGGLWNRLEVLLAAVWWLGIGMLIRRERPALGVVTIVLGAGSLVDGIGEIAGIATVASFGLTIYLILAPVWALWFGIAVARGLGEGSSGYAGTTAPQRHSEIPATVHG